jgi:hypothetical protein
MFGPEFQIYSPSLAVARANFMYGLINGGFSGTVAVDHRLIPPRHPQTNGMVERFNGRIAEVAKQTRFPSLQALTDTSHDYVRVYNHSIPQRALKHRTPIQAMKMWQKSNPELFTNAYMITGVLTTSSTTSVVRAWRPNSLQAIPADLPQRVVMVLGWRGFGLEGLQVLFYPLSPLFISGAGQGVRGNQGQSTL